MNSYSFKLKVKIRTKSLMTVGMGQPIYFGIDIPFYRQVILDNNNRSTLQIVIPGSTIKGALRTAAIRIAWMLNLKAAPSIRPEELRQEIDDAIIALFGGPGDAHKWRTSKIFVGNADISIERPIRRSRIKINRKTLKVGERALFTEEVIPIHSEISFEIEAVQLSEKEVDLSLIHI